MRRTNIYLDDAQLKSLRTLGQRRGEPVAHLVRDAVTEYLAAQGVAPLTADEWEARFDALLARRRRVANRRQFDESAVQRDVNLAVEEVRHRRTNATARRR